MIEEEKTVVYKAMDGNAWYQAAAEKHTPKKDATKTFAIIIRGIPNAPSSIEY